MLTAFRIFKTKHAETWFDGEGSRQFGGRWNSAGTKLLYTSASLSLAVLEVLVHLDEDELISAYSYATVKFEESLLIAVEDLGKLHRAWLDSPVAPEGQQKGDDWVESNRSLVLSVPTAIVPDERNYLINIEHPDFHKLKIGKPQHFFLDKRLVKKSTL